MPTTSVLSTARVSFRMPCGMLNEKRKCPLCDVSPSFLMWDMTFCRGQELSIDIFKSEKQQALGVRFGAPDKSSHAAQCSLPCIESVAMDSIALKAGLKPGDVVLEISSTIPTSAANAAKLLRESQGDIQVIIYRPPSELKNPAHQSENFTIQNPHHCPSPEGSKNAVAYTRSSTSTDISRIGAEWTHRWPRMSFIFGLNTPIGSNSIYNNQMGVAK